MNERFLFRGKRKDEQIIKALEYCSTDVRENTCPKCAFYKKHRCSTLMLNAVSDLINRKNAKIEELKTEIERMENQNTLLLKKKCKDINTTRKIIKSEAIKEFAERVETLVLPLLLPATLEERDMVYRCLTIIDNLVKEMTEVQE